MTGIQLQAYLGAVSVSKREGAKDGFFMGGVRLGDYTPGFGKRRFTGFCRIINKAD